MDEDLKNRTFDKYIFKTPKIKTRNLCLRKTKSFYNNSKLETEPSSTSKKVYSTKTHLALVSKFLTHQNSVKQFNTINNSKIMNKTFDVNKNGSKIHIKNKKLNIQIEKDDFQNKTILKTDFNNKKKNIKPEKKDEKNDNFKNKTTENKKIKNRIKDLKLNKSNKEKKNTIINEKGKFENINKIKTKEKNEDKNNKNEIKAKIKDEKKDKIFKNIKEDKDNSKINEIKKENKINIIKGIKKEVNKRNNKRYNTINISNIHDNIKEEKTIKSTKLSLEINKLNIIPLPPRKSASPKSTNHNLTFDTKSLEINDIKYSPKTNKKIISFEKSYKEDTKKIEKIEKENSDHKTIKKDKERINKGILTPKKIEVKNKNNKNHIISSKEEKREFLYIPHIVLDPLEVLKNQVEIILSQFENKIKNLNKSNSENNKPNLIKKSHEEFIIKLNEIYEEKEKELIKVKHIYREKLNALSNNDNKDEEESQEENNKMESEKLIKERDNIIGDIERKFLENKKNLKSENLNKAEQIKKLDNSQKQIELNKEFIEEIKKKLFKIFNDKKMINKRGINFSLKEYRNNIKNNKIVDFKKSKK